MKDVSETRRRLIIAGSAAGAVSAMGFPAIVKAQSDKIRIGHLTPLTGFLGPLENMPRWGSRWPPRRLTNLAAYWEER